MSPKTTVKCKEKRKNPETRDNKAVPGIAYRLSSTITLRSKFKVLKSGDTVALLIRSEAKLFNHIHMVDGQSRFCCYSLCSSPGQSEKRNHPLCLLSKAPATVWRGKNYPCPKEPVLECSKNDFFLKSHFCILFILHDSIIIKHLLFFICMRIFFYSFFFLTKCVQPSPAENFKRALPRFTVGCREIAAASLRDGGMCLIVVVCVRRGMSQFGLRRRTCGNSSK